MRHWIVSFLLAFVPLFVAMDPVGLAGLFMVLSEKLDSARIARLARQATLTAAGVSLAFMLAGKALLSAVGITIADLQAAGGIILLLYGLQAVFDVDGHPAPGNDAGSAGPGGELGVVPLGVPLIAGPATLTALLALVDTRGMGPTLAALLANLLLTYLCMRHVRTLVRLLGRGGIRALSKIVALLLVAIAVNLIRQGLRGL